MNSQKHLSPVRREIEDDAEDVYGVSAQNTSRHLKHDFTVANSINRQSASLHDLLRAESKTSDAKSPANGNADGYLATETAESIKNLYRFKSHVDLFRSQNTKPKTLALSPAPAEPSTPCAGTSLLISQQKLLIQSNNQAQRLLETDLHRIRKMAREQQRKKQEKAASLDWASLQAQAKKSK